MLNDAITDHFIKIIQNTTLINPYFLPAHFICR